MYKGGLGGSPLETFSMTHPLKKYRFLGKFADSCWFVEPPWQIFLTPPEIFYDPPKLFSAHTYEDSFYVTAERQLRKFNPSFHIRLH